MRIDDFCSTVGLIKRRTEAKECADAGLMEVNGRRVKPSYLVNIGDIIHRKGAHQFVIEVLDIPTRSVSKETRHQFFKILSEHTSC
jgi:ribosomal 50S subunit-recycling heat shock protein